MFSFDKISVNQILVLSEIISESALLQLEFIEQKYAKSALNFNETIDFMQELNLLRIRGNKVVVKPKYRELAKDIRHSQRPEQLVREFILSHLFNQRSSFSGYVHDFMSKFHFKDEQCEFAPDAMQRLEYSGLRNFLIDLEFLKLDPTEMKYIILPEYAPIYADLMKPKHMSPDGFIKIQQKRTEIGKAAELQIIKYEKKRLRKFPQLVEKIEHIATKDVVAGYDIKSFEGKRDESGLYIPRFIEVKAVSCYDYRFNWTKNEIETSKRLGQNYFLYLLPVLGKNGFDLESLKMIKDPYLNVYENDTKWVRTDELIAFSLSKAK